MKNHYSFKQAKEKSGQLEYRGISDPLARFLFDQAALVPKNHAIVEIGSFFGYSTIFLAYGAMAGQQAKVHCIDPWGLPPSSKYSREKYTEGKQISEDTYTQFLRNIENASIADLVVAHRAYGHKFSKMWNPGVKIGLFFIDGDHSEWGAYADWYLYKKHLDDGATVVFHDYGHYEVASAIARIPGGVVKDPHVLGAGYKGNEAYAFRYHRDASKPIIELLHYWLLTLRKAR